MTSAAEADIDFIVLQYLEGETLASRLAKGKALPLPEALTVGEQIANALDAAHRAGIVHRDLKPANVFLTKTGARLLDFGLAKPTARGAAILHASQSALATEPAGLTAQGTIVGTVQYMSPEQLEGGTADARSDIFALGAVLYEMVTGKKAFEGKTIVSVMGAILKDTPRAISTQVTLAPPALDHLVERCLEKAPDDRWQSGRDVARDLAWLRRQPGVPAAGDRVQTRTPTAVLAAVIVGLVALTVTGYISVRHLREPGAPEPDVLRFSLALPICSPPRSMCRNCRLMADSSPLPRARAGSSSSGRSPTSRRGNYQT